jgi:hypothetical protein
MAKKPVAKKSKSGKTSSNSGGSSSWWNERSKILAKTAEPKSAKPKAKKAPTRKAGKVEKGNRYYCEVCSSEIVCLEDSAGDIFCCEEPMCLVC